METDLRKFLAVISVTVLLVLSGPLMHARKFSISTDILGYAKLGTLNLDASYAVSRRWSLTAGMRYNPFTFARGTEKQFQAAVLLSGSPFVAVACHVRVVVRK